MKKLLSLMIALVMAIPTFAASNCMNYQAVINKANGTPAANSNIGMKFTIVSGTHTLFEETTTVKSDNNGYVKYAIGSRTDNGLASVDWEKSDIMLQVAVDINGGTNYSTLYSTSIQSVPTAIFANTSLRSIETEMMFDDLQARISYEVERLSEDIRDINDKFTTENEMTRAEIDRINALNNETLDKVNELNEIIEALTDYVDALREHTESTIANLQAQIDELKSSK